MRHFPIDSRSAARAVQQGFTLIELALVLLVLSLILGGGLSYLTAKTNLEKLSTTEIRLKRIEEALWQYRRAYGRLPCAADRMIGPTHLLYGKEGSANSGSCDYSATDVANFYMEPGGTYSLGAIPTRTLNLPDQFMVDGWGRKFSYAISHDLAQPNAFATHPATTGAGFFPITSTDGGDITVRNGAGHILTNPPPRLAAYVVISHGKDGFGGYSKFGTLVSGITHDGDQRKNCKCRQNGTVDDNSSASPDFISKEPVLASGDSHFDDLVRYKTRQQLYSGNTTPETPPVTDFPVNQSPLW